MDKHIRGTMSGFMTPSFVVDLPGGGGKRLASTYEGYDELNGVSYWRAPGLSGEKAKQVYTYFDPYPVSLSADEITRRHEHTKRLVEMECARLRQKWESNDGSNTVNGITDVPIDHVTPHSVKSTLETTDYEDAGRASAYG